MKKPSRATKTSSKKKSLKPVDKIKLFCSLTGYSKKEAQDLFSDDFSKKTKKRSKKSKKSLTHKKSNFA